MSLLTRLNSGSARALVAMVSGAVVLVVGLQSASEGPQFTPVRVNVDASRMLAEANTGFSHPQSQTLSDPTALRDARIARARHALTTETLSVQTQAVAIKPAALVRVVALPVAPTTAVHGTQTSSRVSAVKVYGKAAPVAAAVHPAQVARSSGAAAAVSIALGKLGAPYVWGAAGPNAFDCSGLVQWSFKQAGISLPRTSGAQSQVGTPVAQADLQPGDLVFFYTPVSHVAIYIGGGKVVHASTSTQPVKITEMRWMPFNSARRV